MDKNNIQQDETDFRWTYDELDNSLFAELYSEKPSEEKIRELVAHGANINAIDSKGDSALIDAIKNIQTPVVWEGIGKKTLDIKFIQLIIDLGADVNYAEDGFNCLFDASLNWYPELVELLLKAGANPNCISTEDGESLLEWVSFDRYYEELEGRGGGEPMAKIEQLLKDYGAKPLKELKESE